MIRRQSLVPAVAAIVALALSVVPVPLLAAEAAAGPQVSPASTKAMLAVQQAADAGQFADVVTRVEEALKIPGKTPADVFVANQFLALAHNKLGNKAGVLAALQGELDSGYPPPAEQIRINSDMTRIAYEQKSYAQAVEYGNRVVSTGAADAALYGLVGHSLYQQEKYADATTFLSAHVADQESRGQVPREQTLNTLFSSQEKQGNKADVANTLEKLVAHYPKAEYWNLLLFSLSRDPALSERQTLQLHRLRLATQTMTRCVDFTDMADMAVNAGMPGEAQKAAQAGLAANACAQKADQDRLQRLLESATRAIAEDKSQFAKLEAEAKASKTGELDVVVGSSLFGYESFPQSVEALSRGIAKGGVKNLADAQLMLGIAQIRAGAKPDAVKTLQSIKTDDAFVQRIARLWVLQAR